MDICSFVVIVWLLMCWSQTVSGCVFVWNFWLWLYLTGVGGVLLIVFVRRRRAPSGTPLYLWAGTDVNRRQSLGMGGGDWDIVALSFLYWVPKKERAVYLSPIHLSDPTRPSYTSYPVFSLEKQITLSCQTHSLLLASSGCTLLCSLERVPTHRSSTQKVSIAY